MAGTVSKTVTRPFDCLDCGARILEKGALVVALPRDAWHRMTPGRAYEIILEGLPVPVARCSKCNRRQSLLGAVTVTKTVEWPHTCPCCGNPVKATREKTLVFYHKPQPDS
jgi:hypothetical protein